MKRKYFRNAFTFKEITQQGKDEIFVVFRRPSRDKTIRHAYSILNCDKFVSLLLFLDRVSARLLS